MQQSIRTYWKGRLKIDFVSMPIKIVSAEKPEESIKLNQIDRKTMQRISLVRTTPDGKVVPNEDIVSGFEVAPGKYVLIEDEDMESLRLATRHTLGLTQFVDMAEISPIQFEKPYYVLPDGAASIDAYCVIRDALTRGRKAGIGQFSTRSRENLVALFAMGGGMVMNTLRYAAELKNMDEIFEDVANLTAEKRLRMQASKLLEARGAEFDPSAFRNRYEDALRELIRQKIDTGKVEKAAAIAAAEEQVADLAEALRMSLEAVEAGNDGKKEEEVKGDESKSQGRKKTKEAGKG